MFVYKEVHVYFIVIFTVNTCTVPLVMYVWFRAVSLVAQTGL